MEHNEELDMQTATLFRVWVCRVWATIVENQSEK